MRMLLVEDEQRLASLLQQGLIDHGYAVDVAHDGTSGWERIQVEPYDVVILDIMLPGIDGITLCRKLRAAGLNTPVLMLTARDRVRDRVLGLDSGADDYLTKPFAFPELLARIRALLRRESGSRDPVLRAGDVELDPQARTARRGTRSLELTSKEFGILELFLRNANRVLTRSQIAEHVWSDFAAESNVIDVYVSALRRKLSEAGEPNIIHTVRGIGYQLRSRDSP
ncbi:MAG: response regulator transcription factor [Chloroflexi bacterium]|nr:response regulator transcription factor [Chloroflexota bacterium]